MTLNGNHARDEKRLEEIDAVIHGSARSGDRLLHAIRDARPLPRPGHRAALEDALFAEKAGLTVHADPEVYQPEPDAIVLPPQRLPARRVRLVPLAAAAGWAAAMVGIAALVAQTSGGLGGPDYGAAPDAGALAITTTPSPVPLIVPTGTPLPMTDATRVPDFTLVDPTVVPDFSLGIPTLMPPTVPPPGEVFTVACAPVEPDETLEEFSLRFGVLPFDVLRQNPDLVTITYREGTVSYTIDFTPETCLNVSVVDEAPAVKFLVPASQLEPVDPSQPPLQAGDRVALYGRVAQQGTGSQQMVNALIGSRVTVIEVQAAEGLMILDVPRDAAAVFGWFAQEITNPLTGPTGMFAALFYEVLPAE
jgi:hypothetical protein